MFSLAVVTVMVIYLDDTDDHIFIDIFDSDDFLNYFARRMAVGTEWAWLESTMRPTWIGLDWIGIK